MLLYPMLHKRFPHRILVTFAPTMVALMFCAIASPCAAQEQTPANDVPEPSALEWSLLSPEIPLTADKSGKFRAPTSSSDNSAMSWDRKQKDDGSSAMTVKQSVLPFADAKVGADMTVASQAPGTSEDALVGKLSGESYQSTGSAWANMTAPGLGNIWDKTTVEARVDPSQEQSRVNTAISKTVPIGQQYAITAQTGYNVIQSATPMIGIDGRVAKGATETDHSAKLEFKQTGTSLLAGETMSTMDDKWLRRVGVQQKVFEGVNVTGSVSETPTGIPNRSITAGFKHSW